MPKRKVVSVERRVKEIVERQVGPLVDAVTALVRHYTTLEIADLVALKGVRSRPKRLLPCIAPGCKNLSKGPRFHYLCDDHLGAPKRDWETWQASMRQKRKRDKQSAIRE